MAGGSAGRQYSALCRTVTIFLHVRRTYSGISGYDLYYGLYERLLDYWELHPERYPDVVVFESSYGDIRQEGDNFIWHWLMEEFQPAERKDYPYIAVFTR